MVEWGGSAQEEPPRIHRFPLQIRVDFLASHSAGRTMRRPPRGGAGVRKVDQSPGHAPLRSCRSCSTPHENEDSGG